MVGGEKELLSQAEINFGDTQVQITSKGQAHLVVPLGTAEFVSQFVSEKTEQWSHELKSSTMEPR